MTALKRITMVQTMGVFLVLAALSAVFAFWVPLAQKTFSSDMSAGCRPETFVRKFYLHTAQRKEYFSPSVTTACGQIYTYKLYL